MSDPRRAARIVADWRRRRDEGSSEPPDDLVRAHPDLAEDLRVQLALQRDLEGIASPELPSASAPPRERIGDFRIVREIGRGGMGVVYEARQESMRRTVALKVLSPAVTLNPKAIERFRREAHAAGSLHHTNIVAVHAMGEADGVWYYAMERIRGRTLAEVIADLRRLGHRPPAAPAAATPSTGIASGGTGRAYFTGVASAFAGIADALDHAHAAGILHRDVKPSNLMLDADGTLKLTDFGLARVEEDAAGLTMSGDLLGTPAYMSPEQVRPRSVPLDGRTDVYSLGATLYEFLALRPPFRGESVQDLLAGILAQDAVSTRRANARVPRDLDTIVLKCLEKQPERRYRTAAELARDLRLFAEGAAIRARRTGPLGRALRKMRTHKARTILVATVVACVAVTTSVLWSRAKERERQTADRYDALLFGSEERAMLSSSRLAESLTIWGVDRLLKGPWEADLEEAIALAPGLWQAYYQRALLPMRPLQDRLADLDRALERGLGERAHRLARARVYRDASQGEKADGEVRAAEGLPRTDAPVELDLEANDAGHRGDWKAAIAALTRMLGQRISEPYRGVAYFRRAALREVDGDLAGAVEDLAAARPALEKASPRLIVLGASLWRRLKQPERAEQLFQEALTRARATKGTSGWLFLAEGLEESTEWEWEDRAMAEAVAAFPDVGWFHGAQAGACAAMHDITRARALIDVAFARAPDSIRVLQHRVNILSGMGEDEEALRSARRILELAPGNVFAASSEGKLLVNLGHVDEGIQRMRSVAEANPGVHSGYCMLAWTLWLQNRRDEASAAAERAAVLSPRCPTCARLRARILRASGRMEEALAAAERALRESPRDLDLLTVKGEILHELGRPRESIAALDEALALAPRDGSLRVARSSLLVTRSCVLFDLGQVADAVAAAELAVKVYPQGANCHRAHAQMLAFSGKPREGLAAAEMALQLNPSDCTAHLTKSECLGLLGKFVEALATLDQATGQSPIENAQIHLFRARFLCQMGHFDEFFLEIKQTSAIGPKHALGRSRRWMLQAVLGMLERWEDLRVEALEGMTSEPESYEQVTIAASALYALKRTDDALRLFEEAARKPWPTGAVFRSLADLLAFLGRGDDALRVLDERSPHYPSEKVEFASSRNVVLRRIGRIDDARAMAREMLASTPDLQNRDWWLAVAGEEVEARTLLASAAPPQTPLDAFHRACVHALLGDADPAIHWLSTTLEQRLWPQLPDPDFERIRGDARFAPLERRLLGH